MKYRIILLMVLSFVLAGCSLRNETPPASRVINGQDELGAIRFKESDIVKKINQINSEAVGAQGKSTPSADATANVQMENLSATYNQAVMRTNKGNITLEFYADESPLTVNNFLNLANKGFYNGTTFHRVIKGFMIQGGDPNSKDGDWSNDGTGGPGYQFDDEINAHALVRGSLAMANAGPNTNGSQFFIVTAPSTPHLDGKHTNFGFVVEGMEVVDAIEAVETNENDHPQQDVVIEDIQLKSSLDTKSLNENELRELEARE